MAYQTFKEEKKTPILHKIFQRIEEVRIFLNSFFEARITLTLKPNKDAIGQGGWGGSSPADQYFHEHRTQTFLTHFQQIQSNDILKEHIMTKLYHSRNEGLL